MIPLLKSSRLIVVTGKEAYTALARLFVAAATDGLRCTEYADTSDIEPLRYAENMRNAAQDTGTLSLIRPSRTRCAAMVAAADLTVIAPDGVGNQVWSRGRNGMALPFLLPEFSVSECRVLVPALLAGAWFDNPMTRRPGLVLPNKLHWSEALAPLLATHPTVH